jgi:hypothetical protein
MSPFFSRSWINPHWYTLPDAVMANDVKDPAATATTVSWLREWTIRSGWVSDLPKALLFP